MPLSTAVRLIHATAQAIAEDHGIDILHIKGPAVDQALTGALRRSMDADILVRPAQAEELVSRLQSHQWELAFPFEDGSPFRHAATLRHTALGYLDVHRSFPGIGLSPDRAFASLWAQREVVNIADYPCDVPSRDAQRLILLLHAARAYPRRRADVDHLWGDAPEDIRETIDSLARDLDAEVALAAVTGRLEDYADRREHALWAALVRGERSRTRMWVARVKAEPSWSRKWNTGLSLIRPKPARLQARLGRPPTARDFMRALSKDLLRGLPGLARPRPTSASRDPRRRRRL